MKPLAHARLAAARRGGSWQETIAVQNWIDSSKAAFASVQHRALLHHDVGAWLAQKVFGVVDVAGNNVTAFDLVADHVTEDLGTLVRVECWLDEIPREALRKQRVAPERRNVLILREDAHEGCAARYGGTPEDYAPLIEIFDLVARWTGGHPHAAAILHNSFGPFVVEAILGEALPIGEKLVATRTVCEDLILARMGWIPPASTILSRIPMRPWMSGHETTQAMLDRKTADRQTMPSFPISEPTNAALESFELV